MKASFSFFFILVFVSSIRGQCDDIHIIPFRDYFYSGLTSPFQVIHCKNEEVTNIELEAIQYSYDFDSLIMDYVKTPIKIEIEKYDNNYGVIAKYSGLLEMKIIVDDQVCLKKIKVEPIRTEAFLSRHSSKSNANISVGEFKAQHGLMALIVNLDIDAKCSMKQFEIVRVPIDDIPYKHINIGGRFDSVSRSIINETKGRDLYFFRNIMAKCPGDREQRHLEDLSFDIAESVYDIDTTSYPNGYTVRDYIEIGNGDTIRMDHFTGKYEVLSKGGVKKIDGEFSGRYGCEPGKNGAWVERYSSGILKSIGSYHSDNKSNTWIYFYPSGNIKKIENYEFPYKQKKLANHPLLSGPYVEYHENGEKKCFGEYEILEKYYPTDTTYTIDYETYEESLKIIEGDFWKPISLKIGRWIWFDNKGVLLTITKENPKLGEGLRIIN